jgi:hypothetical protein
MVIAGPAFADAARPVIENNPAPIIAPIPSATNPDALSVFFNPFSESSASAKSWFNGFLFQIDILFWFTVNKSQIYCFFNVATIWESLFLKLFFAFFFEERTVL